ncbi:uncharacterized protein BCR38DRAFT_340586 [Pseudomassariella vexata]|uniref:ML-like domain-containing protein n=1 Tax=Pseudomassariella vexata TaxID=1141098 RepID=A0A1Y2E396_9PEZI|nr:uncharacterized protein BCR38DRAFT_340586 [Pseudomassariella vexata]ORY66031.1 hypothetical protein BCR38DRAFT_340586 [Pseudomassariella vexata]
MNYSQQRAQVVSKPRRHSRSNGRTDTRLLLSRPRLLSNLAFVSIAFLSIQPAAAVFLPFDNCLDDSYIWSNQEPDAVQLQWVPLYADAVFDLVNDNHNLKVTVWGNVTGRVGSDELPAWDNTTAWGNSTQALNGKIQDEPEAGIPNGSGKATTLHSKVDVLSYEPYMQNSNFCENINTTNGACPLAPIFNETAIDLPDGLYAFNLSNNFYSTYAFTSFSPTFIIWYGDTAVTTIGCVSTVVTPDLGGIAWSLRFLPLFVLLLVGVATVFAGVFSPWGTSDVFHWTSNYGRDPDLLRLVTPGFGDCLQYIQFIVLTGGLSLDYPGFYQPVTSNGAWSALIFNESFVAKAEPWEVVIDGIYFTNGTYGLQSLAQLVGMREVEDIWAGMMIWLLVIIGVVLFAIQVGFFFRWLLRYIKHTPEEDLRAKNLPFSIGNVIRLVFSYFLLPIVTLSAFQLVVAGESDVVLVVMAVVMLALIVGFAGWLMYLIATTRPRAHLFDDLPTVLLYGPLYNTYSDEAAAFALIPIILTIMRGIALGAVQPSGIAQIVILAVCEVVQMLTLHAFRPFHSPTSMNAYHAGFSALRFVTVLLMVAFAPSMGVKEGSKGWVGYVILLIHGAVLVLGFFLNALQTIIEVIARLCGAGGDDIRGQTRGGLSKIFGARQLQRRMSRRGPRGPRGPSRQSQLSTTRMLDAEQGNKGQYGRVRSESAGSMGILMHNPGQRSSSALDARSIDAYSVPAGGSNFTPTTPGENSTLSSLPPPGQATRPGPAVPTTAADPYYRPPRARRRTNESARPSTTEFKRASMGSIDLSNRRLSQAGGPVIDSDLDGAPSGRATPAPFIAPALYAPVFAPRADYSTREVDFYYGVRGPALNSDAPSRRLGTGPADPTSPVSAATGWLKALFGGKTKDKGKGFEVVRSARMPPAMKARGGEFSDDTPPEGIPVAMGVLRNGPIESDDEETTPKSKARRATSESVGEDLLDDSGEPRVDDDGGEESPRVTQDPPLLPDLDAGESFKVPSRLNSSKTSRQASQKKTRGVLIGPVPHVPRKSSKRNSVVDPICNPSFNVVPPSEASTSQTYFGDIIDLSQTPGASKARLPFDRSNSQKRHSGSSLGLADDVSQMPSTGFSTDSGEDRPTSYGYVHQHNISRIDPASDHDLLGSAAEVVDNSRRASPSSSVSGRS